MGDCQWSRGPRAGLVGFPEVRRMRRILPKNRMVAWKLHLEGEEFSSVPSQDPKIGQRLSVIWGRLEVTDELDLVAWQSRSLIGVG